MHRAGGNDPGPCGFRGVSRVSDGLVYHSAAHYGKAGGADLLVFYSGGVSLYPRQEKVCAASSGFCGDRAFCL